MKKTLLQRLFIGFKKGWQTPTLPDHLVKLQNHPLIRVFRVLGGLSFLIMLGKVHTLTNIYVLYISYFISLLFFIYHIYLTYFRIKHIILLLKSDKLDIKNSPLDKFSTLVARALLCLKGACDTAQPIGFSLGLMIGTDEILKAAKREPIFLPILGGMLNSVLPSKDRVLTPEELRNLKFKTIHNYVDTISIKDLEIKESDSLVDKLKGLCKSGIFSESECDDLTKVIQDNKEIIVNERDQIVSKIVKLLEEEKK